MIGKSSFTISVIGLWHLGEIYSVGLAELGHQVYGIDPDAAVIKNFNKGELPVAEPDLLPLLQKNVAAGRLIYTEDFSRVSISNIVWFTFDTPVDDADQVDTGIIFSSLDKIIPFLREGAVLVFSSQLPVGTSKKIIDYITQKRLELSFMTAYVPENLQLGRAVKSFFEPGRIVIGAEKEKAFSTIENIFGGLGAQFLRMNLVSAEVTKHALNSFLATSLAFIYDIADVCEKVGADIIEVSKALRLDSRIGPGAYLDASIGFSGGTLGRDLVALLSVAEENNLELPVIASAWAKNKSRRQMVVSWLRDKLGDLNGKTIGLLGLTYKAGTSTLRRSLALEVAKELQAAGSLVRATDPQAKAEEVAVISSDLQFSRDPYNAANGCQALILLTNWPEFRELDTLKLQAVMRAPKLFFDARNFLAAKEASFRQAGIQYRGVGRSVN